MFNKFKDREPKETISIIQDFFNDNGYELEIEKTEQSESKTWWCHINLIYNGNKILSSNGKGTNEIFSLASGHAELYERFCAGFQTLSDAIDFSKYLLKTKQLKGYFYNNEKYQSFDEIKNSCYRLKYYFDKVDDKNNYFLSSFAYMYDSQLKNQLPVAPYTNLNTNEIKYFNPQLITKIIGSDGLAAGNTLEEAEVQGLSEVYEHYCEDLIYLDKKEKYYQLNLQSLNITDELKDKIKAIQETNNLIYIFDLSYNYNLPVLMSFLINKNSNTVSFDLGSHPIFDIALERVITEVYQGIYSYGNCKTKFSNKPSKNNTYLQNILENIGGKSSKEFFPENILKDKILINDFNKEVFLTNNKQSNLELIEYMKNINLKNNFSIYIYDFSLCENMKAIQVFCENKNIYQWIADQFDLLTFSQKEEGLKYGYKFIKKILNIYKYNIQDNSNILYNDFLLQNYNENNRINDIFNILYSVSCGLLLAPLNDINMFFTFIKNNILMNDNNLFYYKIFNYYYTLFIYLSNGNYTKNEIIYIMKNLNFDIKNINTDIENIYNINYLYEQIVLNQLKKFNNNNKNMYNIFIRKDINT